MEVDGLTFPETLKLLSERNGIPMPSRLADERHAAAFREISGVATLATELPAASRAR